VVFAIFRYNLLQPALPAEEERMSVEPLKHEIRLPFLEMEEKARVDLSPIVRLHIREDSIKDSGVD
jgi:hypothetical protein